ncbi:hypothetical protein [Pseudemcibacter aquimaris]|uniref:hypothetical protein n=1 Tax=Pseudemcibacter aquimaris TaxID=2857064 RepID=UPI002011CE27|nr:hypothetical protein [Pseudemcibacter aquimaris]MCC3859996.1 hypothetical protein [Pseudemcibacter aquimaris]WDU57327.1 hypothetical protein KW060_08960 [Pseudemcibacter aquimaris]
MVKAFNFKRLTIIAIMSLAFQSQFTLAQELGFKDIYTIRKGAEGTLELPMMLDAETRLDGIGESSGRLLYNYTMINYLATDLSEGLFAKAIFDQQYSQYCDGGVMTQLRTMGIEVDFRYYDKEGAAIAAILFTPEKCTEKPAE